MNRLSSFAASTILTAIRVDRPSMEQLVVDMLERCAIGDSLCPSDVAKAAAEDEWRSAMPSVRTAACRLAARGIVRIVAEGSVTPFDGNWRGPMRLMRGAAWEIARVSSEPARMRRPA